VPYLGGGTARFAKKSGDGSPVCALSVCCCAESARVAGGAAPWRRRLRARGCTLRQIM